jgi:hypothetical protein
VSYQSVLVIVLTSASALIAGLLDSSSGIILAPGLVVVLKVLAATTIPLATNQLKTIGQPAANTVTETRTTTTTPPVEPPQP